MARLVLSDTGPLIGLARIGKLDWLRELFGHVTVTSEVMDEIFAGKGGGDEALIQKAIDEGWLRRLDASLREPHYPHLGVGEASCIRMAVSRSEPTLLLLDDRLARREAKRAGLQIVGVAAMVGMAELRELTPSAHAVFDLLRQSDYRISEPVIEEVLRSVGIAKAQGGKH